MAASQHRKVRLTTEEFIARARAVHGDAYDYSKVVYTTSATPVEVICPQHGSFFPRPNNHVANRSRCPQCAGYAPTTLAQFLTRARAAHGDRYDYSRVVYTKVETKVEIICPTHGPFWQTPLDHAGGHGCAACGVEKSAASRRHDAATFLARARAKFGDALDYRQMDYRNTTTAITIVCPEHGPFRQTPYEHLASTGCPWCTGLKPITQETFLARARAAHGDRYDYTLVDYQGWQVPVAIKCAAHGVFWQTPKAHAQGRGCLACSGLQPVTLSGFIARAQAVHGDRYDYSQVQMTNVSTKVTILCREHGPFAQRPGDHTRLEQGCPACAQKRPIDAQTFLERAQAIHGDAYAYDLDSYQGYRQPVTVTCPSHGVFTPTPHNHIHRHSGCPRCVYANGTSQGEAELADWLAGLGLELVRHDRTLLAGWELDIYLPEHRLGIEYNGTYWHSAERLTTPRQHELKADRAAAAGIRLITVWDFDLRTRGDLMRRHLLHALGRDPGPRWHARRCQVRPVPPLAARAFYEEHHVQGGSNRRAGQSRGLYQDGQLVACMTWGQGLSRRGKAEPGEWELVRYATAGTVRGGASRLFAALVRELAPARVWSYSDRQHFAGGLYPTLGFVLDGTLAADYRVVSRAGQVWHKAAWQRKHIPQRLRELGSEERFDPATDPRSERAMQDLAGVLRIMDAGKHRWLWTAPATNGTG